MRFHARGHGRDAHAHQAVPLYGAQAGLATLATSLPVLLGFVLPCGILLSAMPEQAHELQWARMGQWTINALYQAGGHG